MPVISEETVERVRQRIFDRYGRKGDESLIDIWAEDHASYDHYIQDCMDCQKVWIRMVLESEVCADCCSDDQVKALCASCAGASTPQ